MLACRSAWYGDSFVGYLTTIDLGSGRPISPWRALGTRHEMWFEHFTKAGSVEDPRLRLDLEALSTSSRHRTRGQHDRRPTSPQLALGERCHDEVGLV